MYHSRTPPGPIHGTEVHSASVETRYQLDHQIGSGTFGTVSAARVRGSARFVAVKTLRQSYPCEPTRLREVQFYQAVPPHPNLLALTEIILDVESNYINFVTELLDCNMLDLIRRRAGRPFRPSTVTSVVTQLVRGLAHIHAHGFVHRDIKPENILVITDGGHMQVKIADFGLARQIDREAPANTPWTSYVATRWYRAPEQLLGLPDHSFPLDIWALGTLVAEICNLAPIFPGSNKVDMLTRQLRILGTPCPTSPGGNWLATYFDIPEVSQIMLRKHEGAKSIVKNEALMSFDGVIRCCVQWDPARRASLSTILIKLRLMPSQKLPRKLSRQPLAVSLD